MLTDTRLHQQKKNHQPIYPKKIINPYTHLHLLRLHQGRRRAVGQRGIFDWDLSEWRQSVWALVSPTGFSPELRRGLGGFENYLSAWVADLVFRRGNASSARENTRRGERGERKLKKSFLN